MGERRIEVVANGKPREAGEGQTLVEFLAGLGFAPGMVVVERNGEALTPSEAAAVRLKAGDRLEIVRIVAGG